MISPVSVASLSNEISKIGEGIPLIRRLPRDPEQTLQNISSQIDKSKGLVLGHGNVAVNVRRLGDLEDIGFAKTRLSIPLPGESIGTPSWRRGNLHAHLVGDHYLFHKDAINPEGALRSLSHVIREGIPAAVRRVRQRGEELVVGA